MKIISILGMHRSGTSALAGSLQAAGLPLGDVSTRNRYNPRGNRENAEIMRLHERLLNDNGGTWYRPPSVVHWSEEHLSQARDILAKQPALNHWGFKDPRTLLCVDGWMKIVPDIDFIGIYRHPLAVAKSLSARRSLAIPMSQGLALWYHYNIRLYRLYQGARFPVLSFDFSPVDFNERSRTALCQLGLDVPDSVVDFYDPGLVHQNATGISDLPQAIVQLYECLNKCSKETTSI